MAVLSKGALNNNRFNKSLEYAAIKQKNIVLLCDDEQFAFPSEEDQPTTLKNHGIFDNIAISFVGCDYKNKYWELISSRLDTSVLMLTLKLVFANIS